MTKTVVITDFVQKPTIEKNILGEEVDLICLNELKEDSFDDVIERANAILVWHASLTNRTFERLKNCSVIVRYGTGYENIDLIDSRKAGIDVCNTPDYGVEEVADTACAMMLSCIRQINYYDNTARIIKNGWQTRSRFMLRRTSEHVLGIIGCGRIGTSVALRMKVFGMKIVFFDPKLPTGYEKAIGIERVDSLNELLQRVTIISIHTPLNDETFGMVDKKFLKKVKPDTILVNTSRGAVVANTETLLWGLRNQYLSFVALDVLPVEPPANDDDLIQLWKERCPEIADRVIINPHSAFYSGTSWSEMREKAAQNVRGVLSGGEAKNVVN